MLIYEKETFERKAHIWESSYMRKKHLKVMLIYEKETFEGNAHIWERNI